MPNYLVTQDQNNPNALVYYNTPNFNYSHDNGAQYGVVKDYEERELLKEIKFRLKPSHTVGTGGSDYTRSLESIAAFTSGEYWVKFTGNNMSVTLERKIIVTSGTLSTITAGVSRLADFQRYKKLIPKFVLQSGTGAATVDVLQSIYNPKTMAETRVYVERWDLDDATTFGDQDWIPPRVSTKFKNGIISHPFYDRMFLLGVSGTLNSADYAFHKLQASYATIKTVTLNTANVNDLGYVVVPFVCDIANCLKVTLNNSAGTSVITDQFVKIVL